MLGVSFDTPDDNRAFREKFDFPYDLLSDEDKSATVAYGVVEADAERAKRMSVLIGPDGRVIAAYEQVTPADHPAEVLADLDRLT